MPEAISTARAVLPSGEAAALVRQLVEHDVSTQETLWPRIHSVVSALTRRGEVNHFSEGIRQSLVQHK